MRRAAAAVLVVLGGLFALVGSWVLAANLPRVGQGLDRQARGWVILAATLGVILLASGVSFCAAGVGVVRNRRWARILGLVTSFLAGAVATIAGTSVPLLLVIALGCCLAFALLVAVERGEAPAGCAGGSTPAGGPSDPPDPAAPAAPANLAVESPTDTLGRWRVARATRVLPAGAIVRVAAGDDTLSVKASGHTWMLGREGAAARIDAGRLRLATPYEDLVLEPFDRQDLAAATAALAPR